MTIGSRSRPGPAPVALAIGALSALGAVGLVGPALASTWCDPGVDPGCPSDGPSDGYADDSSGRWYGDGSSEPFTDDPYATTWYEEYPDDDPYATTWYQEGYPDDPDGTTWVESGFEPGPRPTPTTIGAVPPAVLALVDTDGTRGEGFDPADLPIDEAVVAGAAQLVLGIDAVAELGAFRRDPDPFVNDAVRSIRQRIPADGLNPEGYRSEIRILAEDIGELVELLERNGGVGEPVLDVEEALTDLDLLQRLEAGDTALFEPNDWLSAAADLLLRAGAEPELGRDTGDDDLAAVLALADRLAGTNAGVVQPPTVSSTTTPSEPRAIVPADDDLPAGSPDEATSWPTLAWLVALLGGVALVGGLVQRRRARSAAAEPAPPTGRSMSSARPAAAADPGPEPAGVPVGHASLEDLLDVSRRMTSSLDATEVAGIALTEAERLVDGEGGLLAIWDGDTFRVLCHRPPSLFDLDAIGDGSIRRVVETGRSVVQVTDDEPALVEVPMAMAAIPVVAEGRVVGAILVVRVPSLPFARQDLDGLEMLAPLIGSALLAAETHGSATQLADIDPLTGLNNRRRLTADLEAAAGRPLVAIMIDIDHFKTFNDTNGHAAGDEALRRVSAILAENVRPGDVAYRYGGEEFCVLLADTLIGEAATVAERVRAAVEAVDIPGGENQPAGRVTISVGVASSLAGSHDGVIEVADAALYQAKHGGRNRVTTSPT